MREDGIAKIQIDDDGRLCVWPQAVTFGMIYRSASEVHWDAKSKFLYSPRPREWSYSDWFGQIWSAAASEYEIKLKPHQNTDWTNISPELKSEIEAFLSGDFIKTYYP